MLAASTDEDDESVAPEDPGERSSIRRRPLEATAVFALKMQTLVARWIAMLVWRDSLNPLNAPTHWVVTLRRFDDYLAGGLTTDMDANGLAYRLLRFFDFKCKLDYTQEALLDCVNICFGLHVSTSSEKWSTFLQNLGPKIVAHIISLNQADLDLVVNDEWFHVMKPIITRLTIEEMRVVATDATGF